MTTDFSEITKRMSEHIQFDFPGVNIKRNKKRNCFFQYFIEEIFRINIRSSGYYYRK